MGVVYGRGLSFWPRVTSGSTICRYIYLLAFVQACAHTYHCAHVCVHDLKKKKIAKEERRLIRARGRKSPGFGWFCLITRFLRSRNILGSSFSRMVFWKSTVFYFRIRIPCRIYSIRLIDMSSNPQCFPKLATLLLHFIFHLFFFSPRVTGQVTVILFFFFRRNERCVVECTAFSCCRRNFPTGHPSSPDRCWHSFVTRGNAYVLSRTDLVLSVGLLLFWCFYSLVSF